jgi:hypothetical protein
MQMFANINGASRSHLGGGDQNVHLAHLQVEGPKGVVVNIRNDTIQHAEPNGNALAGDLVDHRLHILGGHFIPPDFYCIYTYMIRQEGVRGFPKGTRNPGEIVTAIDYGRQIDAANCTEGVRRPRCNRGKRRLGEV